MPKRLQLSRKKGYKRPEGAVLISRPSMWGNPYRIEPGRGITKPFKYVVYDDNRAVSICCLDLEGAREVAVDMFKAYMRREPMLRAAARTTLRGRDLLCWCPVGSPCHGDVLLKIANRARSRA
jgi:hypothetical protein